MPGACRNQKKVSDPLELVSYHVGMENYTGSSARAPSVSNPLSISLTPIVEILVNFWLKDGCVWIN